MPRSRWYDIDFITPNSSYNLSIILKYLIQSYSLGYHLKVGDKSISIGMGLHVSRSRRHISSPLVPVSLFDGDLSYQALKRQGGHS